MGKKVKIKFDEIKNIEVGEAPQFPKYTTQLLNLANQNSQATRPRYVGQMTDLIQEFDGHTFEEWKDWYESRYPDARGKASDRIEDMVDKLTIAINKIDREMIEKWVEDLVLYKTFVGLNFQEAILKKLADKTDSTYRLASAEEESLGIDGFLEDIGAVSEGEEDYVLKIDGFVDDKPVSIKPITYDAKPQLQEKIDVEIVYYDKKRDGITIEHNF